ncbi:MAG: Gfo/Idh/MocA family oxidoreductase, partial [Gammaproteobacteria bacterium]|nr:Gfo/Idh/MocA family oxidoreductase [Gammaproteobacteria bacterium]
MKSQRIGIIMHGVTGRMGMNQHLIRSVLAIRNQGGIPLKDGTMLIPDPILIGRNPDKIQALAEQHNVVRWGTDIDKALANPDDTIFFDAASTQLRPELLRRAIDAGKHVYCEKPISEGLEDAVNIARYAKSSGVKNGIV